MSIRNQVLRVLFSVIASAILLLTLASNAKADTVGSLQINGLRNYVGKYLTVYYAIGHRASINTEGDQIHMRQVTLKKTIPITSDMINLPSVELPRSGLFLPYNILVFVVHATPQFHWINTDGSMVDGDDASGIEQYVTVDSLTKTEFEFLQNRRQSYQFGESKTSLSNSL